MAFTSARVLLDLKVIFGLCRSYMWTLQVLCGLYNCKSYLDFASSMWTLLVLCGLC
jgi:hypothetical protein